MNRESVIIAPLVRPAVCLMLGIAAGRFVSWPQWPVLGVLAVFVLLTLLAGRRELLQSLCLETACIALGLLLCLHQKEALTVAWPEEDGHWAFVVSSEPTERGKTLAMDALVAETGQKIQLRIMADEQSRQLTAGDGIIAQTTLRPLTATGSYRTYQETHGYVGEAFVTRRHWQHESISLEHIGSGAKVRLFFMQQRRKLLQQITPNIRERDDYSILAAMTLGDKSAVSREQKEQFAIAGTSHLLALSGLHLGIIYMLMTYLFRSRRLRLVNQLLIVGSIWAFVLLVGMPLSVIRAALMISIYAFVSMLNRSKTPINTLALSAVIILLANPYALFDVGFQLSFASVLAILLFMPLATPHRSARPAGTLARARTLNPQPFLYQMTMVSIAAQIGTAPLVAYYFGRFPVWFLLANYVSIPLSYCILSTMLVTLLLGWWPTLQALVLNIPVTLASWLNSWTQWVASLPFASIDGLHPTMLQTSLAYVIVFCLWYLLRYRREHEPEKLRKE